MHKTIVKCSAPGCEGEASTKVAAPWKEGAHSELKTYGYSCPDHSASVADYAGKRFRSPHLSSGESVGPIGSFPLAHS